MFSRRRLAWFSTTLASSITLVLIPTIAAAGEGPYLGVEGGVNWESPQNLHSDGAILDRLHFDDGWTAGVIAGYSTPFGLRPEIELDHRRNDVHRDEYGLPVSGGENADSALANLWYDFKLPNGPQQRFHPYIGAGAGALRLQNRSVSIGGIGTSADSDTKFAWQAGAGLGFDVTPRVTVSVDYRYLESDRGRFNVEFAPSWHEDYRTQTALLSVRYSFGSAPRPAPAAPEPPPMPSPPPPAPAPPPVVEAPPCRPPAGFQVDANCHIIDQTLIVRAVDFEFNRIELTKPAQETLNEVAHALTLQPELAVEIDGYTDSIGGAAYNLKLSQRRADAVKDYLAGHGVDPATLTAKGFGKDDPIATNATAEGRAENRRVAFRVTQVPEHLHVTSGAATEATTEAAEKNSERGARGATK